MYGPVQSILSPASFAKSQRRLLPLKRTKEFFMNLPFKKPVSKVLCTGSPWPKTLIQCQEPAIHNFSLLQPVTPQALITHLPNTADENTNKGSQLSNRLQYLLPESPQFHPPRGNSQLSQPSSFSWSPHPSPPLPAPGLCQHGTR